MIMTPEGILKLTNQNTGIANIGNIKLEIFSMENALGI